jgi:hypothetical protein
MRKPSALLGLLAILAISAVGAVPAQAGYDYPVCLRVYGAPTYNECGYTTMAQCAATASGRSAQCFVNPFFASAADVPQGRRHQRRYGAY